MKIIRIVFVHSLVMLQAAGQILSVYSSLLPCHFLPLIMLNVSFVIAEIFG